LSVCSSDHNTGILNLKQTGRKEQNWYERFPRKVTDLPIIKFQLKR